MTSLKFISVSSNTHRDKVILTGIMHNVNAPKKLHDFHNYITKFTYLLTPWSRVLLENLTGFQLVKKLPALCRNRRYIIAFKCLPPYPDPA
jgi:hypothetical protein